MPIPQRRMTTPARLTEMRAQLLTLKGAPADHATREALATLIWQECNRYDAPISVHASSIAATCAVELLNITVNPPDDTRPNIAWVIEQLGPKDLTWGHLASRLRRIADQIDARNTAHMMKEAQAA